MCLCVCVCAEEDQRKPGGFLEEAGWRAQTPRDFCSWFLPCVCLSAVTVHSHCFCFGSRWSGPSHFPFTPTPLHPLTPEALGQVRAAACCLGQGALLTHAFLPVEGHSVPWRKGQPETREHMTSQDYLLLFSWVVVGGQDSPQYSTTCPGPHGDRHLRLRTQDLPIQAPLRSCRVSPGSYPTP